MTKIFILPSLFTTANLCCGLLSLTLSINQRFSEAAWAILIAILFDMVDGKIARLTKTTSNFGKEFDSLADLVTFGVAPFLLMHEMALKSFHKVGIVVGMIYVICGTLRLARFNIQPSSQLKQHFIGLPIPAAAGVVATFGLWGQEYGYHIFGVLPFLMLLLACLMVSRVRFPCKLWINVGQNHLVNLVAIILGVGLIFLYPLQALAVLSFFYLFVGGLCLKLRKKSHQEVESEIDLEPEVMEESDIEKSYRTG